MTNLTLEERERMAYISGNTSEAALYAEMIDMEEEIQGLENKVDDLEMYGCRGCDECY